MELRELVPNKETQVRSGVYCVGYLKLLPSAARKMRDWWQNPKCVFCVLLESMTLYVFNIITVLDRK